MKHSLNLWLLAVVCLAGVSTTRAFAEPPKPAGKPAAAAPAKPADAPPSAAGEACGKDGCMMKGEGEHGCPMMQAAELADAKVDNTAQGATITFTAKKAEDTQKVQEIAKRMADHIGKGGCQMGKGHGMMKHGGTGGPGHDHH